MNVDVISNLTSTIVGVASTIILLAVLSVVGIIVKNLPKGIRRAVSTLFALMFVATFLTGIVWQALCVLTSRSMLYAVLSVKLVGISTVFGFIFFSAERVRYVLFKGRLFLNYLFFDKGTFSDFAKEKKSSSSSFELKVSSVLLQ